MRKITLALLSVLFLAACGADNYYETELNYYQDGDDCVYYNYETGDGIIEGVSEIETSERIVYRNVRCSKLFKHDREGYDIRRDRKILIPTESKFEEVVEEPVVQPIVIKIQKDSRNVKKSTCSKSRNVVKSRYYIVQGQN